MTYHAVATRDEGRYWLVRIVELDQLTQARNLTDIEQMARELITLCVDPRPDVVEVIVTIELPVSVQAALHQADQLMLETGRLKAESARMRSRAAKDLKSRGLTIREIGRALGISHQRAQQLVRMKGTNDNGN